MSSMPGSESAAAPPVRARAIEADATAPDGSEIRVLADSRNGATASSLVEVILPAGQVTRPVYHRTVEETWYILEGQGRVWRCPPDGAVDGTPAVAVSPGDALVIPTGWRFQFQASQGGLLRFLCHTTPPWPGEGEALLVERGGLGAPTL